MLKAAVQESRLTPPHAHQSWNRYKKRLGQVQTILKGLVRFPYPGECRWTMSTMSALPSQGQPPVIESTLPPMPRRQSCDRCHEQKVRCVTDAYDPNALGLGTTGEETEVSRGMSVVAPIPCVRCSKAGAVCIFSPQLRSGRPRVHRHPVRKRARRSSKCSSSPNDLSPTQSQSLSPRPFTFSFSASNSRPELETQSHTPTTPLLLSTTIQPSFAQSYSSQGGTDLGTPTTLLSNFGLPINQDGISLRHNHFQAMPHPVENSSAELMSQFSDRVLSATSTAASNVWMYSDSCEGHLEEVTQINLRIHRAGRMLCSLTRTLLTISSPALNEIFDAACSLIGFLDRYATRQIIPPSTPLDRRRTGSDGYQISLGVAEGSVPISSATETSISLTALASHQLLLGIFEDLCTSSLSQIDRERSTTPSNTASTSSHSQMLAMAKLISHLLEQLDRALQSLTIQRHTPESSEGLTVAAAAAVASTHDSEFDHALGFGHPPEPSQPSPISSFGSQNYEKRAPSSHRSGMNMILAQVEQRQVRTREQLMMLKGLLGQDGV